MTITVEDGTGLSTSESYISVTNASTYHSNRGNAAWAALASDTVREQLLRKATDYMVQAYRLRWKGDRVSATQALDWPRSSVCVDGYSVDSDIVPNEVQTACAELALKASSATLYADQSQGVVREKIGPIETEYDKNSSQAVQYKAIDSMLRPYLARPAGVAEVIRR
ncbi:MAG: DnaT-like ssDNA-binding protein [Candidatus Paceibacterota bacterium]|jgi:hypothetical protein